MIAFVTWANGHFGLGAEPIASRRIRRCAFDLSTWDLYGGFAAGAEVHLVPPQLNLFPGRLVEFIRGHRLTQWFSVPSLLAYLARFDAVQPGDFPELRRIIWCGEVFATPPLRYWMERVPHASFTNLYGPTETTIASSWFRVEAPPSDLSATVPIGRACHGETLYVLGPDLELLPEGETGEIGIGGAGVTHGYWRDPERTQAAFIALPSDARQPGLSHRRSRPTRCGRPAALPRPQGLADQVARPSHRARRDRGGAAQRARDRPGRGPGAAQAELGSHTICCAYAVRAGVELAPTAARERLAALVPRYMLPARWRAMDRLPTNANGKVDRVALREMFAEDQASQ